MPVPGTAAATPTQTPEATSSTPAAAVDSTSLLDAPQNSTEGATEGESLLDLPAKGDAASGSTSTDGHPEGEAKPNSEGKQGEEQKPVGAPEAYADFSFPEGISASPETITEFKTIAKELNLSQEHAQKLVDLQTKYVKTQTDAALSQYKQTVEGWKKETLQSLGANAKQELAFAAKTRDRFGTPELKQLLNDTGLANHKSVVSFFQKVGKAISEDVFVGGKSGTVREKSAASVLYPNLNETRR